MWSLRMAAHVLQRLITLERDASIPRSTSLSPSRKKTFAIACLGGPEV